MCYINVLYELSVVFFVFYFSKELNNLIAGKIKLKEKWLGLGLGLGLFFVVFLCAVFFML